MHNGAVASKGLEKEVWKREKKKKNLKATYHIFELKAQCVRQPLFPSQHPRHIAPGCSWMETDAQELLLKPALDRRRARFTS